MPKKIIAVCGSLKAASTNLSLIKAIAKISEGQFEVEIFNGLASLPHFNPDLDNEHVPESVADFRARLRNSDGILISTPEYAMGVPGTLKNALDWTVSSMEFSKKPTALITASSMGQKGHQSLLETLKIIEANITDETQLLISHAQTKISKDGEFKDAQTQSEIRTLLDALYRLMNA